MENLKAAFRALRCDGGGVENGRCEVSKTAVFELASRAPAGILTEHFLSPHRGATLYLVIV